MNQRVVLNLTNKVTNIKLTESHEAAMFIELDYQRHERNVHIVE
jgi:hypothetical protein